MTGPHPPSIPPRPKAGPDGRRTVSSRSLPVPDEVTATPPTQSPAAAVEQVVDQVAAAGVVEAEVTPPAAGRVAAAGRPAVAAAAPAPPDVAPPAAAAPVAAAAAAAAVASPPAAAAPAAPAPPAPEPPAAAPGSAVLRAPEPDAAAPGSSGPATSDPATSEPATRDAADPEVGAVEAPDGEPESQTALAAAVAATGGWLRRAGRATSTTVSSAYASITRPAPEDDEMTTTKPAPAAVPGAHDVPIAGWPGAAEAQRTAPGAPRPAGPRRVRLAISRVDPWSVMKLSFLLSFALGIIGVVATAVVWFTLDGLHVFAKLNDLMTTVAGADSAQQVMSYLSFGKIAAGSMLVGVVDVFLITALCTIGAFLYNIVAALVGGLHVTMTDD